MFVYVCPFQCQCMDKTYVHVFNHAFIYCSKLVTYPYTSNGVSYRTVRQNGSLPTVTILLISVCFYVSYYVLPWFHLENFIRGGKFGHYNERWA